MLESGKTDGVAALITSDSDLTSAVLDEDFYASAVARPEDATVVAAIETEPGTVYVTVEYTLDTQKRDIKVAVVEEAGEPKIDGWLHETLSLAPLRAAGAVERNGRPSAAWEVNRTYVVGDLEKSVQFVALPGIYSFEFVNPAGTAPRSFTVEFPIDFVELTANVPTGVTARGSEISVDLTTP